MATLSVQTVSETDAAVSFANADSGSGDLVPNKGGNVFLILKNGHATGAATVTITAQNTSKSVEGWGPLTKSDIAVSLAAGDEKIVGPFAEGAWNNSSDQIALSYTGTAAADVDVAALKLG